MSTKDRRKNSSSIGVSVPVTPMLDMTFQLLFFFVSTFNYSPVEGQIPLKLPADGCRIGYPAPETELKDPIKITVYAEGGDFKFFEVDAAAFRRESIPNLKELLKTFDLVLVKEKVVLNLEIPNSLPYAKLMSIMDALRQAGFYDISISGMSKA